MASPNGLVGIGGIMGGGGGGGGGYGNAGLSYTAGALAAAYAHYHVTVNAADTQSDAVPDSCLLSAFDIALDTIAGATSLEDVYLAEDDAGLYPLSHPVDVTFILSLTATRYVASIIINRVYYRSQVGTAGTVFFIGRLNAGTANFVGRLRWVE